MKVIDRLLLAALVRRHPVIASGALDLPEALASSRAALGVTRSEVAHRTAGSVVEVLAFDLGITDPRLSTLRRYAHAAGLTVGHHVDADSEADR